MIMEMIMLPFILEHIFYHNIQDDNYYKYEERYERNYENDHGRIMGTSCTRHDLNKHDL